MTINDLTYIHIPKTGGWSMYNTLKSVGYNDFYGHAFGRDINLDGKFVFTIVRNPWARLVSTYTFLIKGSDVHTPPESKIFKGLGINSFTEFVEYLYVNNEKSDDVYILPNNKGNGINLFTMNQVNWILNGDKELTNHICKLEDLDNSITKLNELTGVGLSVPPKGNVTNHGDFREMYNSDTIEMVSKLYDKDITHFNFTFDDRG